VILTKPRMGIPSSVSHGCVNCQLYGDKGDERDKNIKSYDESKEAKRQKHKIISIHGKVVFINSNPNSTDEQNNEWGEEKKKKDKTKQI